LKNVPKHRDPLPIDASRPPARHALSADRIATIVELGVRTIGADRCAIAFRSSGAGADDVVYAPHGDLHWDEPLNALLDALANRLTDAVAAGGMKRARRSPSPIESIEKIALSSDEIDRIARIKKISDRHQAAAMALTDGVSAVRIAIVAGADRARGELEASLELMARAVIGEITLGAARASLEFWRTHGAESGRQAAGARQELVRERAATNYLDEAVAVAGGAGFDQWVVAVADSGSFIVAASSSGQKQFDLGETSALAESFQRRIVIARWRDRDEAAADRSRQYFEDKMFGGPYVCIPFEAGSIALASRDARASAATAEAIVERLAPFAAAWMLEREAARRTRLVRQLALRMFAAIDEERARIARDLHDDQAQLLAAAKIALDGPPDAARSIFKQVEDELRRKTRELRATTLGNSSLDQALEREFGRLNRAGVTATLTHSGAAERVSRPVQQLCFLVSREALSNVIRHARAKSVQVTIETSDASVRVSVADDGCGLSANQDEGIGLAGVRERLELMGGRLTLESHAGGTTVVAEIPGSG
jgi:signal transduction histidine kinase